MGEWLKSTIVEMPDTMIILYQCTLYSIVKLFLGSIICIFNKSKYVSVFILLLSFLADSLFLFLVVVPSANIFVILLNIVGFLSMITLPTILEVNAERHG